MFRAFTVTASKSNRFKLNECISCYHATTANKYRESSRRNHPKLIRSQEESVSGGGRLTARSRNCKLHDDPDVRLHNNVSRNAVQIKSGMHVSLNKNNNDNNTSFQVHSGLQRYL